MSGEAGNILPRYTTWSISFALLLALGLYFLVLGGIAIYLLAPLLLPPPLVENDTSPLFVVSLQALAFVFLGGLIVPGSLLALKAVHWLVAIAMLLLSLLLASGPGLLFSSQNIPISPVTLFSLVMLLLGLIALIRLKPLWPLLWRALLVAGIATAIPTIVLLWPSPPGVYASPYLDPLMAVIILVAGYWFASRARVSEPGA